MEEKSNIKKIIINSTHELTDVVKEIHQSKAERIVLTFTDQTDLLISPINLKVINEVAQKEGKLLISQIIQNPTGVRNSNLAGIKVIEKPSLPTEEEWVEVEQDFELQSKSSKSRKKVEEAIEEEALQKTSSFEERVNNAISKSREERYVPKKEKADDSFISIDSDIPVKREESLAGKDFASIPITETPTIERRREQSTPKDSMFSKFKGIKIDFKDKKFLKVLFIAIGILLVVPGVSFAIYNQMAPLVKVKIFVEAKSVEIEKTLIGDENIEEIDFDNLKIPIKTGEATKSLSDTINPTGKAYKGEKAKGSVTITYWKGAACNETSPKVIISNGHTITTDKYSYKTNSAVEMNCNSMATIEVTAADIGEEYNIAASRPFSVTGYNVSEVYGLNSAAFTGGSKQEYTVLSQQDLDSAVETLSTTAIEEVKSELREKESNWEIIENSIKSEVDKESIKTDKKVGEEASIVNLDVTIKGTATYYSTKNLNEGLTELLREEALENNLFESENDIELVLGDTVEKKLTVDDTVKDSVQIKLEAQSSIRPKVGKDEIENKLKGMSWSEGLSFITTLDYSDQKTEIQFIPSNYPEFLKRFPNRRGGVLVTIVELKVTD